MRAKKIITFLCMCAVIATTYNMQVSVAAESTTYGSTSSDLSYYGFSVDAATYNKTCTAVKSTQNLYSTSSGDKVIFQTSRVFICREKGTYNDVVLTHVEIVPQKYTGKNKLGINTKYRAYPESLTVSCTFPSWVEYKTSSPKTQAVKESYSLEASISGKELGVTGSMNVDVEALTIKNQSNQGSNLFKIFYDFKPGFWGYSSLLEDYLYNTTEHIGLTAVTSKDKNYTFTMKFVTNTAYTYGAIIYNGDECTKLSESRTIKTNFK